MAMPGKLVCVSSDMTILRLVIAFRAQSGLKVLVSLSPVSAVSKTECQCPPAAAFKSQKTENNGKFGSLLFGLNIFKSALLAPSVPNVLFSINQLSIYVALLPAHIIRKMM